MPKHLPAGLTQYVLNYYSSNAPPYHVTSDNVEEQVRRLQVENITGDQLVRGRSDMIAFTYETLLKTFSCFLEAGS